MALLVSVASYKLVGIPTQAVSVSAGTLVSGFQFVASRFWNVETDWGANTETQIQLFLGRAGAFDTRIAIALIVFVVVWAFVLTVQFIGDIAETVLTRRHFVMSGPFCQVSITDET